MEPSFEQMTPAERILYVQHLWDRIAEDPEGVPVSDAMKAELDRRLAAHRADPSTAIPWEQVKAELRRRRWTPVPRSRAQQPSSGVPSQS